MHQIQAAEQLVRVETRVPYGIRHLVVQEESKEEKNRENEASGPDSQVVKVIVIPLKAIDLWQFNRFWILFRTLRREGYFGMKRPKYLTKTPPQYSQK